MKQDIWIDTDLSVGKQRQTREGYCDVDDGYAVLQLMKADAVMIRGISAVFGNTSIDHAYSLCQHMAKEYSPYSIPVFRGAEEAVYLAEVHTNEAVEALAKTLRKQALRILAIGPATNVGLLLLKYPELASQIQEVVLVAGRRKPTDYFAIGTQGNRARDLNFDLDNDAFRLLLERQVPVTLCPFEISSKVWLRQADLVRLAQGDKGCQWLAQHSRAWLQQWIDQGAEGFNPYDVLASHYLQFPDDIVSEPRHARLEIHPDDTQEGNERLCFKQYLLCDEGPGYPVNYCYDVVADYHKRLMNSFGL